MVAWAFSALLIFSAAGQASAQNDKIVRVGVGQSMNVTTPKGVTQVHVLNPRVCDVVRYFNNGATIVGISGGVTEIHFTLASGRIHKVKVQVSKQQVSEMLQAVKDFLGPVEGVFPRMFGDLVIIEGRALTAGDYGRVSKAVRLFGEKRVLSFAGYQPSAVAEINKTLEVAGLNTVQANLYGGMVYMEGAVGSDVELKKVHNIISQLDLKVVDLLTVGKGRQVLVTVKFLEVSEKNNINFGLDLPAAITAQGAIMGDIGIKPPSTQVRVQLMAPEQSMSAKFNMLFERGHARLLAKPKLVCGSGGKAKFMVGGEIPIVVCTIAGCTVTYKEYGVLLHVEPIADTRGFVTAKLYAEVSAPDWANAIQGYPAFVKRSVDTTVTLQEGSTLILSGLYKNEGSKGVRKIPLLGHIPILGELFKSRSFGREKSQLAILITPRIINPQHPWVRRTIKSVERRYEDYKRKIEWEIFD
jgi:pilus assembly protein CpaC